MARLQAVLPFPILKGYLVALATGTATLLTSVLATVAAVEALIAGFIVYRFLGTRTGSQRLYLYCLGTLAFLDPVLNAWTLSLPVREAGAGPILWLQVQSFVPNWFVTGIGILVVWGLSKAMVALTSQED